MKYVVIDTNVVISAFLKADSVPGKIIQYALGGKIKPFIVTPKEMLDLIDGE